MSSGLLDLVGIVLLGVVSSVVMDMQLTDRHTIKVRGLLQIIGLGRLNPPMSIAVLSFIAFVFFVLKGLSSSLVNYRLFLLLGRNEVRIGEQSLLVAVNEKNSRAIETTTQTVGVDLSSGVMAGFTRLLGYFVIACGELASLITISVILFVVDPLTSVCAFLFFGGIGFVIQKIVSRRAREFGGLLASSTSTTIKIVQEVLGLSREIVLAGRQTDVATKYRLTKSEVALSNARLLTIGTIPRHVIDTSLLLGAALMATLLFSTKSQEDAAVSLAFFLIASARLAPSILSLQGAFSGMVQAAEEGEGALKRIRSLPINQSGPGSRKIEYPYSTPTYIDIQNLTYEIDGVPLIKDVTLQIPAGSFVGIVGPSGAGKSTLIDLILGLPPTRGTVLIDGLSPMRLQELHPGAIAFVPQASLVLDASIGENVSLKASGFDHAHVYACLVAAGLSSLLEDGEDGLESRIGSSGRILSGGESQRLSVARALYCNPRLIIMDEPTSALDSETEIIITRLIESMSPGCTVLVIAHRFSTIQNADIVISIDNGSVIDVDFRRRNLKSILPKNRSI